jgi:hypothetical protein
MPGWLHTVAGKVTVTDERRYSDGEVEEIFRSAAAEPVGRRDLPAREGLTLADLQEIGREAGISPERVALAAARLDRPVDTVPRRTVLGLPVAVGHTVGLPRAPTDREWGILVAGFRETFAAHGRESSVAGIRSWSNGNLRIAIEPTETGYRLRMATRKGNAAPMAGLGLMFVVLAIMSLVSAEGGSGDLLQAILYWLMGVGAVAFGAVRLSSWADERSEQMGQIAERTRELLSRTPAEAPPAGE